MKLRFSAIFLLLMVCVSVAPFANADDIQTLGQFNGGGPFYDPGPFPTYTVGTFNILPGDTAVTISGTFGNSTVVNSSGVDIYLGSILVGQCVEHAQCWTGGSPTPWSDTLTAAQIALLGTGPVNLTAVQTSQYIVRLGDTTLDQVATPEPSSIFLFGTSLLGAGSLLRRKLVR